MESPSIAKRLWHIMRVVYYMLRKGVSKRKLMLELHLLLQRGKLAGKAISNLMTFHPHHHQHGAATGLSAFSCRSMDPNLSFYNPREVEFSCSNTPSYPSSHATKRKRRRHHHHDSHYDYDAAAIAKAFEILNSEASDAESIVASPSPAPLWSFGKSPAPVRQLRITDSPFAIREEEEESDGWVDRASEEFIKRFYEQLRQQQMAAVTPEYLYHRRSGGPVLLSRA